MSCIKWLPQYERWVMDDGRIFRPGHPHEPAIVECKLKHRKDDYLEFCYGSKPNRGGSKLKMVHIAVAEAFVPNPDNKPTVDHIDRDRQNNCKDNLRWATYSEQTRNTRNVIQLYHELGVDPELCLSSTEREHVKYACDHGGFRERKKRSARKYAAKHYALGETYHNCPDGHRRWHKPGECPICKSN